MQSPVRHKKCRPARGSGATSGKTAKQQNRKSRPKATRRNAGVLFGRQAAATQPAARFCQILRQSFLVRTPQKARLFPAAFAARLLAVSCPAAARRPPFARRAALGAADFPLFRYFCPLCKGRSPPYFPVSGHSTESLAKSTKIGIKLSQIPVVPNIDIFVR